MYCVSIFFFFFQAEDGIRDYKVTGVQTCALPIFEGFEKIIAIKRILPTMGEDRDFIKMFIDEAKIAGQLAHANICQIFELGRIDGSHFIAMEYIWGKDLLQIQNRLRKIKQPMPVQMACFTLAKVLEG